MELKVLLFFALVASISAHDHLKSRQHVHARHSHLKNRDNSDESQSTNNSTEASESGHLSVSYNASTEFQIVYNQTGRVGAVVDSKSSIVVIFCETSGFAIGVYLKLKIGVQLSNDNLSGGWSAYLSEQVSLQAVIESRNSSSFNATSPPSEVSQHIKAILSNLSTQYCKLPNFISDVDAVASVIRQYSVNIRSFRTQIRGDFAFVVHRFEGVGALLHGSNVAGNRSVCLNIGSLLQQSSGIDFLRGLIEQLPPNFDIQRLLGNGLQSRYGFVSFLGHYSSFYRVISSVAAARNGSCNVQELVKSSVEYFRSERREGNESAAVQSLLTAFGRFNSFSSVSQNFQNFDLQSFLNGIQNSSTIINALQNPNQNGGIFNIVQILSGVSTVVPVNASIPNFFGQIISLYRTTDSTSILGNLIPSDSTSRFGSVANIVRDFIQLFMRGVQTGIHIAEFFISLPLRFMLSPIVAAVSAFFRGLNFTDLFRSRNAIEFFIQGLMAFIRIPIAFFSAMVAGFMSVFQNAVEVGEEFVEGVVGPANGGGSENGTGILGGGLNLPDLGLGQSREHAHMRHSHKERHHSVKEKQHGHKEKRHDIKEKAEHHVQHKKREIKEKRIGIKQKRHDVKQKKHEVHHS